jgi:hypothetical protein
MLSNDPFYHQTIKKYIQIFSTLFNDITIVRTEADGSTSKVIKVPLSYAAKEKVLVRPDQEPAQEGKKFSIVLPTMGFQLDNLEYDGKRKLNTLGQKSITWTDKNYKSSVYNPVPYNFFFSLNIYVKNTEDATKIVEQILPFFTPDFTPTVELFSEQNLSVSHDIPIVFNKIAVSDTYEGSFVNQRVVIWTLTFTLKGYLYGPVKRIPVIKFANTALYLANNEVDPLTINTSAISSHVTIQPGLDANGNPTSNIALTIPYANISANDNWTYIVLTTNDLEA